MRVVLEFAVAPISVPLLGKNVLISEEQEAGTTACTAGIISTSFGREWQHFITCLSKCIIERVTSSTGALHCTPNNRKTVKCVWTEILTTATELTDIH